MSETFAKIYEAKYYCIECDSVCYYYTWEEISDSAGVKRCDCSDYGDEEDDE